MKQSPLLSLVFVTGAASILVCACCAPPAVSSPALSPSEGIDGTASAEAITPIPERPELDEDKVALGNLLFHDVRLSGDDTVSCATCHSLSKGGTDQLPRSIGIRKQEGGINAPTVLNASHNFVQFWNGRARTLQDQADGPPTNPKEMDSSWPEIVGKLQKDAELVAKFQAVYGTGPSKEAITDAIATFEKTCTTPNSPLDKYLKGDKSALSPEAIRGYSLFKDYGCASCHQGVNVGGNMYVKFGVMDDYFKERGTELTDADQGRYAITKRPEDMHVFKVPSLRNIALTGPYFHDASAETLPQAIQSMAKYQLGRTIAPEEMIDIVRFLESLTGDQPKVSK